MMKRVIALLVYVVMLCAVFGALAEEMAPLYATVGDALAVAGENPVAGGEDGYYAVVTMQEGKYYRSVAETDDKYNELQEATWEADTDHMEAAFAALDEYIRTLPIAYSEEFTAMPMGEAEMESLVGMTLSALREAGYEDRESGTEGDDIVYVMRNGLFDYACVVNADINAYEKAQEIWPDGDADFVIKRVSCRGISAEAAFKRFHTDGTVEETPDPFAEYTDLVGEVLEMLENAPNGEGVDADVFFDGLKERYPDQSESIDLYKMLYQMFGAEGFSAMLMPGALEEASAEGALYAGIDPWGNPLSVTLTQTDPLCGVWSQNFYGDLFVKDFETVQDGFTLEGPLSDSVYNTCRYTGRIAMDGDTLIVTFTDGEMITDSTEGGSTSYHVAALDDAQRTVKLVPAVPGDYSSATTLDAAAVEAFAAEVRQLYLDADWDGMARLIEYPIVLYAGIMIHNEDEFVAFMADKSWSEADIEAMTAETCVGMMCNGEGICLGGGQIWLRDVAFDGVEQAGEPQLRVIALSGIAE